jgi:hypothetical protein
MSIYRTNVMTHSIKLVCLALMISIPGISTAGFRCANGKLVSEGNTKSEVKIKCGQPIDKEYVGIVKINQERVDLDRWIYNPGKGRLLKILDFHDGVLAEIKDGPRM